MKFIAVILVSYISLLTVSPSLCGIVSALEKVDLCCNSGNEGKCSKEESKDKKKSEKSDCDEPCLPCCSLQSCLCYFESVSREDIQIQIFTITKKIPVKNDNLFSDFLSDFWHPPEVA